MSNGSDSPKEEEERKFSRQSMRLLDVISEGENEESIHHSKKCMCQPKVLVVDDTEYNLLAVKV